MIDAPSSVTSETRHHSAETAAIVLAAAKDAGRVVGVGDHLVVAVVAAAIMALGKRYHQLADYWGQAKTRGAVGVAKEMRQAAARVVGAAQDIAALAQAAALATTESQAATILAPSVIPAQRAPGEALAYLTGATDSYDPASPAALATTASPAVARGWVAPTLLDPATPPVDLEAGGVSDFDAVNSGCPEPPGGPAAPGMPTLLDPRPPGQADWIGDLPQRERLGWPDVISHARNHPRRREVRSPSQIAGYESCGVAYALSGSNLGRPGWGQVGGIALHAAVTGFEMITHSIGGDPAKAEEILGDASGQWDYHLARAIAEMEADRPLFPQACWRPSARGKEGYDWWRVEGLEMLRGWRSARVGGALSGWRVALTPNGLPMIEWSTTIEATTPPIAVRLDFAWRRPDDQYEVMDLKTGSKPGEDRLQLTAYALAANLGVPALTLLSTWDARRAARVDLAGGRHATDRDIENLAYRAAALHRGDLAEVYPPNLANYCGSCDVRDLCPAHG